MALLPLTTATGDGRVRTSRSYALHETDLAQQSLGVVATRPVEPGRRPVDPSGGAGRPGADTEPDHPVRDLWQKAERDPWRRFSGQRAPARRPSRGAVTIDAGGPEGVKTNPQQPALRAGDEPPGWRRIEVAHRHAARFEEYASERLSRYTSGQRRSFRLV